jgi:hypothetical protein
MILPALITFALAATFASNSQEAKKAEAPVELAHVSNSLHFVVHAPLSRVAPLFGPEAERNWAGKHWNPEFVYPQEAKDVQGAVFTVKHGSHTGVWVNTVFDLETGRMQYVYFIADVLVTTVDVKLTPLGASDTTVDVTYVRTALVADANDDVRSLGDRDRAAGPEWQEAIEGYFKDQHK